MAGPLIAIVLAFLLAGVPVALAALAGRMSPLYRLDTAVYLRWWGWFAFLILLCVYVQDLLGAR